MFPHVPAAAMMIGRKIGPYVIEKAIGKGGFADVFLARRGQPFRQNVAIKLINGSLQEQDEIIARFNLERQVLAGLSHEYIARLLDGGQTADGRPYLVMEYVDGASITERRAPAAHISYGSEGLADGL